jgi:hypothetical protein
MQMMRTLTLIARSFVVYNALSKIYLFRYCKELQRIVEIGARIELVEAEARIRERMPRSSDFAWASLSYLDIRRWRSHSIAGAPGSDFNLPVFHDSNARFLMPRNLRKSVASRPAVAYRVVGSGASALRQIASSSTGTCGLIARGN